MTTPADDTSVARVDIGDASWHWDKRVPIALIATLFFSFAGQSVMAVWWASKMDARVEALEKHQEKQALILTPATDRLTRVEVKLENLQSGITDIKDILRSQSQPRAK
jgi:type II secretory pathway component PulL